MQEESVLEEVAPPHTRLIRFEEAVAAIGLLLMLVQVCTEIVLRDFFNTSFLWSEEVARYLMIWSVYFGAAAAVGTNGHLRIEMLIDAVS
ncbi:MAG: TRAP transporter small permease subunit, partial [Caldimonas sp.]